MTFWQFFRKEGRQRTLTVLLCIIFSNVMKSVGFLLVLFLCRNSVTLYDFTSATPVAHTVSLPTTVTDLHMISGERLLVCDKTKDK